MEKPFEGEKNVIILSQEERDEIKKIALDKIRGGDLRTATEVLRDSFLSYGISSRPHEDVLSALAEEITEEKNTELISRFLAKGASKTPPTERGAKYGKGGITYRPENGYQPERD